MAYITWTMALIASSTSLIFSEVMKLPPCQLCWYQRVFMFSLVFVLPVGILSRDKKIHRYALALILPGFIISLYHNLIYYDLIEEAFAVCNAQLSCKTKQLELFGFLSIPLMSLFTFFILMILNLKKVFSK